MRSAETSTSTPFVGQIAAAGTGAAEHLLEVEALPAAADKYNINELKDIIGGAHNG